LYQVNSNDDVGDTTITRFGNEVEYLHEVEVSERMTQEPMVKTDFEYISKEATEDERMELMDLVNEFYDCSLNIYMSWVVLQ